MAACSATWRCFSKAAQQEEKEHEVTHGRPNQTWSELQVTYQNTLFCQGNVPPAVAVWSAVTLSNIWGRQQWLCVQCQTTWSASVDSSAKGQVSPQTSSKADSTEQNEAKQKYISESLSKNRFNWYLTA